MATKKEIDKIFFRLDWWQYLRWQSPELIAEVMTRFMNHCSGQTPLDIDEGTKPQNTAETFLFPMVLQFERDKASYDEACRQNAANISKRWNKKKQEAAPEEAPEDTTEYDQENRNTTEYETIRPNTTEYDQENRNTKKGKERKGIEKNLFFFNTGEETSPEKEKKELLSDLAVYFLSKAVLKPYTTAEAAFNFNESQGWKTINKNGSMKDHSANKLAYLKGWQAEGHNYSLDDAAFFLDFAKRFGLLEPEIIDNFHGLQVQNALYFMFDKQTVAVRFNDYFRSNQDLIDTACSMISGRYPSINKFKAIVFKKD